MKNVVTEKHEVEKNTPSCVATSLCGGARLEVSNLPNGVYIVCREQSEQYYGLLRSHPLTNPYIWRKLRCRQPLLNTLRKNDIYVNRKGFIDSRMTCVGRQWREKTLKEWEVIGIKASKVRTETCATLPGRAL
eukprot:TRINITY_DN6687_c0_g2_i1.p1 TRINITY_DN6687_c0_g2~~TRINITY_DN6687_c0_g2_i1.p1  ORF type:complete len:133 (-),score=9.14 TRINITY_DN6687_c0_g2_i1:260-658(-)